MPLLPEFIDRVQIYTFVVETTIVHIAADDLRWIEPVMVKYGVDATLQAARIIFHTYSQKETDAELNNYGDNVKHAYKALQARRNSFDHIESLLIN
jgi:hypothetical protein